MDFITGIFNKANTWLVDQFGELGPLIAVGGLGLLLVLIALPTILSKKKDPFDKLREANDQGAGKSKKRGGLRQSGKNEKLDRFSQYLEPQDEKELSATQLQMIRAGYRSKSAIQIFNFS
jgi:tight adherence protein C